MPVKVDSNYISQSEFARRIGTSRQNVSYALKQGTISMSKKHPKLINWKIQGKAYKNNRTLSQVRVREPSKQLAKKDKKPRVSRKKYEKDDDIGPIKPIYGISSMNNVGLSDYDDEYEGDKEDAVGPPKGSYLWNQNRKVASEADRHELKFAVELGQVIPTDVALSIAGSKMMAIKDALLALPSRTVGLIEADIKTKVATWEEGQQELLSNSISNILKSSVNDVLSALAAGEDSLPKDVRKALEKK